jgi:hypothetical protein
MLHMRQQRAAGLLSIDQLARVSSGTVFLRADSPPVEWAHCLVLSALSSVVAKATGDGMYSAKW